MMSSTYSCCYCKESFVFKKTLKLHKEKVHINPSFDANVSSLGDIISSEVGFNITLAIENVEKPAKTKSKTPLVNLNGGRKRKKASRCPQCSLSSSDYPLLLSHQMLEHAAKLTPVHYCGYSGCWFPFGTHLEKTEHEKSKHGSVIDAFVCIICKKRYPSRSLKYLAHVKSCAKKTVYKCPCGPPCSFETRKFAVLRKHVKTIHNKLLESFSKSNYEIKSSLVIEQGEAVQDEDDIKQEPVEVKLSIGNVDESHIYSGDNAIAVQLSKEDDSKDNDVIQCPFDSRRFSKITDLHKHVHAYHLDIGDDSIDCPFCEELWTCFCGRQINNRDSLVLHSLRCEVIRNLRPGSESLTASQPARGTLTAKRRAVKKYKELGFKDTLNSDDKLRLDQMKMVESISLSPNRIKTEPITEKKKNDVIYIVSEDDNISENEESPVLNLSPAKRKSRKTKTSLSSIFVKCCDCDKVYHRARIASHECAESESEGIIALSDSDDND